MTQAVQVPYVVYSGNGSTTAFSIPFGFESNNSYIEVILADADGVETAQSYTTHYTISGTTLTMVTAPPSGYSLYIGRNASLLQEKDFVLSGSLRVEEIESGLDVLSRQIQQIDSAVDRSLQFKKTSNGQSAVVPSFEDQAEKILIVGDDEASLDFGPTLSDFNASVAAAAASASAAASSASASASSATSASNSASTATTQASAASASASSASSSASAAATSAADAAQSAIDAAAAAVGNVAQEVPVGAVDGVNADFTLSNTPNSSANLRVYVNGVYQRPTTYYTRVGAVITFVTPPTTGDEIDAIYSY